MDIGPRNHNIFAEKKMPEFYIEALKNHRTRFKCKQTGKKSLLTCDRCHAITYCGVECQKADWDRHNWNCVPVMVKEFLGKGRGIVAARYIKMGERIFKDKPVIKLATDAKGEPVDPEFMASLREQIENLPTEAKSQYYKLTVAKTDAIANIYNVSRSDFEVFKLFLGNCKILKGQGKEEDEYYSLLHLNVALVNNSCIPNADLSRPKLQMADGSQDLSNELRAIKDISKGEEITIFYYLDVKKYSVLRKWKAAIRKFYRFDCKCPMCLGKVAFPEKTLKKLIEQNNKLNLTPTACDWKREAKTCSRILELTMELNIGSPIEKIRALGFLVRSAQLARDKDLVMKTMNKLRQLAEDTKLEYMRKCYDTFEMGLSQGSADLNSGIPPEQREIDFFFELFKN